jgi:DNA-binding NtrC family response regulator
MTLEPEDLIAIPVGGDRVVVVLRGAASEAAIDQMLELARSMDAEASLAILLRIHPDTPIDRLIHQLHQASSPAAVPGPHAEPTALRRPARGTGEHNIQGRLAEIERAAIAHALELESNNRTRAARQLGLSRRALLYKIKKYGL